MAYLKGLNDALKKKQNKYDPETDTDTDVDTTTDDSSNSD